MSLWSLVQAVIPLPSHGHAAMIMTRLISLMMMQPSPSEGTAAPMRGARDSLATDRRVDDYGSRSTEGSYQSRLKNSDSRQLLSVMPRARGKPSAFFHDCALIFHGGITNDVFQFLISRRSPAMVL